MRLRKERVALLEADKFLELLVPQDILDDVRPGDSLQVVCGNARASQRVWCFIMARVVGEGIYAAYTMHATSYYPKNQKLIIEDRFVINVSRGFNRFSY